MRTAFTLLGILSFLMFVGLYFISRIQIVPMITLYIKSPCQYSARAIAAFDAYNVPIEQKNIADPEVEAELLKIGGHHKVPFMVDGDVHLYESDDIIAYVEKHFGDGKGTLKFPQAKPGDTCSI